MGRKRRVGPGHNEANRQSKESRSKSKMLNAGKEAHFRYDVEQILVEDAEMEPEIWRPFLQTLWTQGSRQGIEEAKEWVKLQESDGVISHDVRNKILNLIDSTVRYR